MKHVFLELVFRSLYIAIFYIGLSVLFYLTYGLQLEYAYACFHNYYQCADFCFESGAWQWYEIGHIKQLDSHSWFNENPFNINKVQHHQSKSWAFLGLASVLYFNALSYPVHIFAWIILKLELIAFVIIQAYGFLLPGLLNDYRLIRILELVTIIMILIIIPGLTLYVMSLLAELKIEPYDSELLFLS